MLGMVTRHTQRNFCLVVVGGLTLAMMGVLVAHALAPKKFGRERLDAVPDMTVPMCLKSTESQVPYGYSGTYCQDLRRHNNRTTWSLVPKAFPISTKFLYFGTCPSCDSAWMLSETHSNSRANFKLEGNGCFDPFTVDCNWVEWQEKTEDWQESKLEFQTCDLESCHFRNPNLAWWITLVSLCSTCLFCMMGLSLCCIECQDLQEQRRRSETYVFPSNSNYPISLSATSGHNGISKRLSQ
jgi:hypothetical protein